MALVALAGSAGALALVDADYGRYARSPRDVFIMALAGAIAIDIVMVVAGTIVIYAATGYVVHYVTAHNLAPSGHPAMAYANHMAQNNTGAFFFVFASIAGFLLMYAAQAKAQVLNTYSGSLALSNFFDALLQWRPGRLAMVILGNIIGLAMIAGGILNMLQQWLGILGILTTIFVGVIAADFYIVRRGVTARRRDVEGFNAAGIVTIIVAFGISYWLQNSQSNVLSLGFMDALILSAITYPILRLTVLKPGVLSGKAVTVEMALIEE